MPSTRSNVSAAPSPYNSLRLTTVALAVTAAMAMAACGKSPKNKLPHGSRCPPSL